VISSARTGCVEDEDEEGWNCSGNLERSSGILLGPYTHTSRYTSKLIGESHQSYTFTISFRIDIISIDEMERLDSDLDSHSQQLEVTHHPHLNSSMD
jgi:hypothetical protein